MQGGGEPVAVTLAPLLRLRLDHRRATPSVRIRGPSQRRNGHAAGHRVRRTRVRIRRPKSSLTSTRTRRRSRRICCWDLYEDLYSESDDAERTATMDGLVHREEAEQRITHRLSGATSRSRKTTILATSPSTRSATPSTVLDWSIRKRNFSSTMITLRPWTSPQRASRRSSRCSATRCLRSGMLVTRTTSEPKLPFPVLFGVMKDVLSANLQRPIELEDLARFADVCAQFLAPLVSHFDLADPAEIETYRKAGGALGRSNELRESLCQIMYAAQVGFRSPWYEERLKTAVMRDEHNAHQQRSEARLARRERHTGVQVILVGRCTAFASRRWREVRLPRDSRTKVFSAQSSQC